MTDIRLYSGPLFRSKNVMCCCWFFFSKLSEIKIYSFISSLDLDEDDEELYLPVQRDWFFLSCLTWYWSADFSAVIFHSQSVILVYCTSFVWLLSIWVFSHSSSSPTLSSRRGDDAVPWLTQRYSLVVQIHLPVCDWLTSFLFKECVDIAMPYGHVLDHTSDLIVDEVSFAFEMILDDCDRCHETSQKISWVTVFGQLLINETL